MPSSVPNQPASTSPSEPWRGSASYIPSATSRWCVAVFRGHRECPAIVARTDGLRLRQPGKLIKKVQMRGGAREPRARRTACTSSVRPRAPTKQMGLFHPPASSARTRRRRRRARAAWRARRRGASAPCRSWCTGRGARRGTNCSARPMVAGDLLGRLDAVGRDVDDADQHVLAVEQPQQRRAARASWAHSSETWSMRLFASSGKICSYWRHSPPSVFFQSMLALMP